MSHYLERLVYQGLYPWVYLESLDTVLSVESEKSKLLSRV